MTITINAPCIITPRLLPGLQIGEAFVSIEYSRRQGSESHRVRYRYHIDLPDNQEYTADDLQSGCNHSLQNGLGTLLSFLEAAGEAYRHEMGHGKGSSDNGDMFPEYVMEWCYQNSDELTMLAMELEEGEDIIVEG